MAHDPAVTLGSPTEFGETYFLSCDDCGGTPLAGPSEDLDEIEALLEIHRWATAGLDRASGQTVGSLPCREVTEEEFAVVYEALRRVDTYTHAEVAGIVAADPEAWRVVQAVATRIPARDDPHRPSSVNNAGSSRWRRTSVES